MGKKKRKRHDEPPPNSNNNPSASSSSQPSSSSGPIELRAADVATTIATLNYLAERPELLAHKALRELRAALHPIVEQQLKKFDPVDYVARVTTALRGGHGADALLALQGLHARGQTARQGTVQRWVRDCDSITDAALRVKLLHAVLRAGKPLEGGEGGEGGEGDEEGAASSGALAAADADAEEEEEEAGEEAEEEEEEARDDAQMNAAVERPQPQQPSKQTVVVLPPWRPSAASSSSTGSSSDDGDDASHGPLIPDVGYRSELGIRVVMSESGPERQPPNHYDLHIYSVSPSLMLLRHDTPPPTRVDVPNVPGAFVLLNVLSRQECANLTAVAESIGYTPDHPLSRPTASGIGGLEWLFSQATMDTLRDRCKGLLPAKLCGGKLAGINARCRLFRYTDAEKAVYRPHIDGSWPGSGVDFTGKYVHDNFGDRRSRLTFLIYLNDGFEGGCTTFYLPAANGGLNARGVVPRAGSVLCFPQGNTASLLHEGSAVTKGTKDVIRTDVLYMNPARGR